MKKIPLVLFAFFLFLPTLFSQVSDKNKKNAKTAYNLAVENIKNLDLTVALTNLDDALELDPGLTLALVQKAKVEVALGKVEEALRDFSFASEKDPQNGEVDFYLGYLPLNDDTAEIIINRFNEAIRKGYKEPQAFYYRALFKLLKKDYLPAIDDFNKAIELKPDYALAYHDRATAKRAIGDMQGALYDYRLAINYQNNFPNAFNNMGSVRISLGDFQGALADYSVAINLDPEFYIAYNNRGTAKYFLGQNDSALIDFDKAISFQKDFAPSLNNKAACLSKNAAYSESIALFDQVILSDNTFGKAYLNRGLVRELTGDLEGACSDWKKALENGIPEAEKYLKECK